MRETWASEVLEAAARKDSDEEVRFLSLVDEAAGQCTPEVVTILMRTFSGQPDFGTQERVCSVLATAEPALYVRALLNELPRLMAEAPEWADALVGEQVEHQPALLSRITSSMPAPVRMSLRQLLGKPEFREFHPNAGQIGF
jgi:hypothetical protein